MKNIFQLTRSAIKALTTRFPGAFHTVDSGLAFGLVQHSIMRCSRGETKWGPWIPSLNLLTYQGLDYLLNGGLAGGTVYGSFYVAPFAANVAPVSTLTAAEFPGTQTEFTNYTQGARQQWMPGAGSVDGVISNSASAAVITVGTGGQTTCYGIGLASASAVSATSGVLVACTLFGTGKTGLASTDQLGFKHTITITSS